MALSGYEEETYEIKVVGTTGQTTILSAEASFSLIVKNPCVDETFLTIEKTPLPYVKDYTLFDNAYSFTHDSFKVLANPAALALCGDLKYIVSFNEEVIGPKTTPIAYESSLRKFEIYSEQESLIGTHEISVFAVLRNYQQIRSS